MSGYPENKPYPSEPYSQPYGGHSGPGESNSQSYGGQYGHSGPTVLTTQPNVVVMNQHSTTPNNYMILSILSCLFCVWPIGLAAIFFSSMSSDSARSGDLEGAATKGKVALGLSITSIFLGVTIICVIVGLWASGYFVYYYNPYL